MNVLSLFDGMSCGQLALQRAGIPIGNYFAAEIDKYAIKVATANFPDMIQLGDVREIKTVRGWKPDDPHCMLDEFNFGHKIDLLIGGSPCQGFSFAGKQLNFDDPRSKLFWEYVRLLNALKPKYFLLENVKMKKESMDVITRALRVDPIFINSRLFSAQNRPRMYWTNIPFDVPTEDKGIVLRDILEPEVEEKYYAGKKLRESYMGGNQLNPKYKSQCNTIYPTDGKFATLCAGTHGYSFGYVPAPSPDGGHLQPKISDNTTTYRKLTPLECERLQTVPEGYTDHVSDTQRYKMLGNGWTVDVVSHILKGLTQ